LRSRIVPVLGSIAVAIEHVGSTAVPGLAAKPIIDMDVVVASAGDVRVAIERLAALGYVHQGNLGIVGREAFETPAGLPAHHLYVCIHGGAALQNHLQVRDYLRRHADAAATYGRLKKTLAESFPDDIEKYMSGKTDFLTGVLRSAVRDAG
jgi:GrpB-like predicted nucleotidyltransferase (UPF0157 family)